MDAELSLGICPGWDKGLYRKGRALAGLKVKIKLLSNLNNPHMSCLICCVFLILRADSCATVSFATKHSLTKVATHFSNQWETLKRDIHLSAGHREVSLVLTCWCSCIGCLATHTGCDPSAVVMFTVQVTATLTMSPCLQHHCSCCTGSHYFPLRPARLS